MTPFTDDGSIDLDALARADRLAARAGVARHLGRRVDRRADLADRRGADRRDAGRRGRDRRPRPVPAGHRHGADERDAGADRRGRAPRRRGGARRHPLLRPRAAAGPVRVVRAGRAASSRTCRSSSTTSRSGRRSTSRRRRSAGCAATLDNIVGIKETTRDFEHVSYVLDECGTDFIALSGIELLCYPMLTLGGRGHLSCVGNFAPRPVAELYDAFVGRRPRAGARAPLRPAPARRRRLRRDQPRARQVDHGAARPDRPSAFAREPLAPSATRDGERVVELLERSPHVSLPAAA